MSEDHTEAFSARNGFRHNGIWIGAGSLDPTISSPASNPPKGSTYHSDNSFTYKKFGSSVGDWKLHRGTDHHAGFNLIPSSTVEVVEAGKNMISHGLDIEGELCLDGYLIMEA